MMEFSYEGFPIGSVSDPDAEFWWPKLNTKNLQPNKITQFFPSQYFNSFSWRSPYKTWD